LAAEPSNVYAAYNLAKLRLQRGDAAGAEPLVAHALAGRDDFPAALLLQRCVLFSLGRAQAALAPLERAMAVRPPDFATLYHYARALQAVDRLPEAEQAIARALELEPGSADALFNHGCM